MMIEKLLAFILLAGLASCSSIAPDPYLTTQAVEAEAPPAATDISAEFAAAYLPAYAGGIQSVRQSVTNNALHQEIVYANQTRFSGENVLTINIGAPETAEFLRPPSVSQLSREMRAALPGVNPVISPVIGDNVSGAFGYATATVNQGSCIYAWQYIRQVMPDDTTGFKKFTRRHLAANVRLRYCHPSIPADRIHAMMDGLRMKAVTSETIDMLRFAAGTGDVATPVAVVIPEPVIRKRKLVRQAAVTDDGDWRPKLTQKVKEDSSPDFIDNAATVPLPEGATDQRVTMPADADAETSQRRAIPDAAEIPIPE